MKVRWEYEGKQYVISGHKGGKMYLNKYLYDGCDEILEGLESHDPHTRTIAKSKAKRAFKMLREYHSQDGYMQEKRHREYVEQKRRENKRREEWQSIKSNWWLWLVGIILGIAVISGIIYLIFTLWWIFIGDSIFNGPFEYSTGEAIGFTALFFIALICVLSDVVLRIIRGHF